MTRNEDLSYQRPCCNHSFSTITAEIGVCFDITIRQCALTSQRLWRQNLPRFQVVLTRSSYPPIPSRPCTTGADHIKPTLLVRLGPRCASPRLAFLSCTVFTLRVQVIADSALQFPSTFAKHVRQVLEIVTSSEAKFPDKVFGGALKVTIVVLGNVVFGASEVSVR